MADTYLTKASFQSGLVSLKNGFDKTYVARANEAKYDVLKAETADEGYAVTYQLCVDEGGTKTPLGDKINFAKDVFVKSVSPKPIVVTEANIPVAGYQVGDKYIDFELSVKGSEGTDHLYILVSEITTILHAGNGITISENNEIGLKLATE